MLRGHTTRAQQIPLYIAPLQPIALHSPRRSHPLRALLPHILTLDNIYPATTSPPSLLRIPQKCVRVVMNFVESEYLTNVRKALYPFLASALEMLSDLHILHPVPLLVYVCSAVRCISLFDSSF